MNILTVIIVLYLGIAVYRGYKRGAVRMILSLVGTFVVFALSIALTPDVSQFLQEYTSLDETISQQIDDYVSDQIGDVLSQSMIGTGMTEISDGQEILLQQFDLEQKYQDWLEESGISPEQSLFHISEFLDYLNQAVTEFVMNIIAFIVTFIFLRILLAVLLILFHVLTALPVISQVNHLSGAALSLVEALLILWCLCLVLEVCAASQWGSELINQVNESAFLQLIYQNNLVITLWKEFQ